jgi:hypothetical protein
VPSKKDVGGQMKPMPSKQISDTIVSYLGTCTCVHARHKYTSDTTQHDSHVGTDHISGKCCISST